MKNFLTLILCLLLVYVESFNLLSDSTNKRIRAGLNPKVQAFAERDTDVFERYYAQRVDQYSATDTRRWLQRYYSVENFYAVGGPIIIYIHGFEPFDQVDLDLTLVKQLAIESNAIVYAIENRFFGRSQPIVNDRNDLERLRYYTVEQSLADYLNLILYIKNYMNQVDSKRIFLFGTGSGATLATWLVNEFQTLLQVEGVWASSASLVVKTEFEDYYSDIGVTLKRDGGEQCYNRIAGAFKDIASSIENGETKTIETLFNLYQPIKTDDPSDVGILFGTLAAYVSSVIEYTDSQTISELCQYIINNPEFSTDIEAFAYYVWYINGGQNNTLSAGYDTLIDFLKTDSINSEAAQGSRQAAFMNCNQMSLFKTSSGIGHPFGNRFPLNLFTQACRDIFGPTFTDEYIDFENTMINSMVGGTPSVNNFYFTNGGNDPFRLLGITEDLNLWAPADVIPLYGKSRDLAPLSQSDSYFLWLAKHRVRELYLSLV